MLLLLGGKVYYMKKLRYLIFAVLLVLPLCLWAAAAKSSAPVSPALEIMAAKTDMAKTVPSGENMNFTAQDFMRALNSSKISSVTIKTLPPKEDGALTVAGGAVKKGQTVSGKNLDTLCFIPADKNIKESYFTFSADGTLPITCRVFFIDKENYCPTLSLASEASLTVRTHEQNSATGTLQAYDPDGDKLYFEIVSYPKNGAVVLSDRESGRFTYTPIGNFTGSDSFEYVARDVYGNYSACATVSISVSEKQTSVVFSDIDDCDIYNAALTMAENSLMSGAVSDGLTQFDPDGSISRAEFVMTAMKAAGISSPAENLSDFFTDVSSLAKETRDYVNTAYKMGFVGGTEIDGKLCFMPDSTVTRAEAAVVINNIITSMKTVEAPIVRPVFADASSLPAWAKEAIYTVSNLGILKHENGYVSPDMPVSRGDAALMLEAMIFMKK